MGARFLTDLAEVCRLTGYPVIEVEGWQTRARGSGGYDQGRPNHVMAHHSASPPSSDGRQDMEYCTYYADNAPLCNLYLSRVPEIWVCAAGATNTNGSGIDPCGILPPDTMNASAIGIEAANTGVGEPWGSAQQDCYVQLVSELCIGYGIGTAQIHAHFEYAPSRKIDPAGESRYATGAAMWDMDVFVRDVAAGGHVPTPPEPEPEPEPEPVPPPDQEDDLMAFIIKNNITHEVALVYGDGKLTGLAGADIERYETRFGEALVTDPVVWADFIAKGKG
jgi:hypothetical protein